MTSAGDRARAAAFLARIDELQKSVDHYSQPVEAQFPIGP